MNCQAGSGTAAWLYRCLVESLVGLCGDGQGLRIAPQPPAHWPRLRAWRRFRGAEFELEVERVPGLQARRVAVDGQWLEGGRLDSIEPGRRYRVRVELPPSEATPAAVVGQAGA